MKENKISLTKLSKNKFHNYQERIWDENFDLLKKLRKTSDYQPSEKENYKLNRWLHNQKLKTVKGFLSNEKIKKLESLHFKGNYNDKIWDRNFNLLKEYRKSHKWTITKKENKQLYSWLQVEKKKKRKNLLSEDRRKKLDSLNFNENYRDKIWEKNFNLLKEYRINHDFKPSEEENKKFYYWLERQKAMQKKGLLLDKKISKMESLNFKGNQIDRKWYKNFELLRKYRKKNEFTPTIKENKELSLWLKRQKSIKKKGLLSDEKIRKLASLNFKGNQIDKKWYKNFELLRKYRQKNEFTPAIKENRAISRWLQKQKAKQKNGLLSDEKIRKMESLHFKGNQIDKEWYRNFELLKNYWKNNEFFPTLKENKELTLWLQRQKAMQKKGLLPDEKINKLESLHFKGNQIDRKWYKNFELLRKYRKKNEFTPTPKENKELSLWLQRQKVMQKKGLLSDEKIKKLEALHFKGKYYDKVWAENYDLLKDFRQKKHGRWPKQRSIEPIEHKLAVWCLTIRTCYKNNKLTKYRFDKLKKINFTLK